MDLFTRIYTHAEACSHQYVYTVANAHTHTMSMMLFTNITCVKEQLNSLHDKSPKTMWAMHTEQDNENPQFLSFRSRMNLNRNIFQEYQTKTADLILFSWRSWANCEFDDDGIRRGQRKAKKKKIEWKEDEKNVLNRIFPLKTRCALQSHCSRNWRFIFGPRTGMR